MRTKLTLLLFLVIIFSTLALAQEEKICSFCGEKTTEYKIFEEQNKIACFDCLKKMEKCASCGIPLEDFILVYDQKICPYCNNTLPRCAACNFPIVGNPNYYENDKKRNYCEYCVKTKPRCDVCDAPLGNFFLVLPDSRSICRFCLGDAVFSRKTTSEIRDKVINFLIQKFQMKVSHPINYISVGADELTKLSHNKNPDKSGLFLVSPDTFKIYFLYGLNEANLIEVIAHEYAHAWLKENQKENLNQKIEEGFPQWVAFKTLEHFGYFSQMLKMSLRNDIYGEGLRDMLQGEKEKGIDFVFKSVVGK
jgi:hypothetical protein